MICVKKTLHLCHSAGPLIAITNLISCFREHEPPACYFWPLTKSQKYENYPSSHGLQLFKSHQRSFDKTSTLRLVRPDLTGRTRLYPTVTTDHKSSLTSLTLRRNKVTRGRFEPFAKRPHNSTTAKPGDYMCAGSPDKQASASSRLVISFLIRLRLACASPPRLCSTCHIPLERRGPRNSLTCCLWVCSPSLFMKMWHRGSGTTHSYYCSGFWQNSGNRRSTT